jgi:hypothetical protein
LSDRELPGGGTLARRYAQRSDLPALERDIAGRIAGAQLGLLQVVRVVPGRQIELRDLTRGEIVEVISHDLSRSLSAGEVIVGRLMAGPPAPSVWGPVAFVTRRSGRALMDILKARVVELGLDDQPFGLATAMHSASREIVALFVPALREDSTGSRAA